MIRSSILLAIVFWLGGIVAFAQGSDQKENILSARRDVKEAPKNRKHCDKLDFPASDNRCFTFYPNDTLTWGKGFSEGLAKVTIRGKAGFINNQGRLVIPAKFNDAGSFGEGLAPFENSKGKWGYIDKNGQIAIPAHFDWAISFSEGLGLVQIGELWGYIDNTGKIVIPAKFEQAESFSEGMAAVGYEKKVTESTVGIKNDKWVQLFIGKDGSPAINYDFDGISRKFDGGMAIVSRSLGYSEKYKGMLSETYIIDRAGIELWKLESATINWFSDDAIVIEVERKSNGASLYNFKDRTGKVLCDTNFEDPSGFSEGLSAVRIDGKYGFISKDCKFEIEPQFSDARSFSEGLAVVEDPSSRLKGFIDKNGKWIVKPQFKWVDDLQDGIALFLDGSKAGYVDRTGKIIWQPSD